MSHNARLAGKCDLDHTLADMRSNGELVGVSVDADLVMDMTTLWIESRWTCNRCGATGFRYREHHFHDWPLVFRDESETLSRISEFVILP